MLIQMLIQKKIIFFQILIFKQTFYEMHNFFLKRFKNLLTNFVIYKL